MVFHRKGLIKHLYFMADKCIFIIHGSHSFGKPFVHYTTLKPCNARYNRKKAHRRSKKNPIRGSDRAQPKT
jgi:hypothetical protein